MGRSTGGGAEHPAEYPAMFRREPRESSASFPPEQISLNLHHFLPTLIIFVHSSGTYQLPSVSTKSRQSSTGYNLHGSPGIYHVEPAVAESMRAMYSRKAPMR